MMTYTVIPVLCSDLYAVCACSGAHESLPYRCIHSMLYNILTYIVVVYTLIKSVCTYTLRRSALQERY